MCVREPQQQTSRGWKLRLQDMESLELHVSMSEEGDTAKKKKKSCSKRNNPHRLQRNQKGVFVGRPGRSAAFPVVTVNFKYSKSAEAHPKLCCHGDAPRREPLQDAGASPWRYKTAH